MRAGQRRHGELEGSAVGLSAIAHGWTAATSPTAGQARVPQQHGPIAAARGNDIRRGGRPAPRSRTHPLPRAYFPARRWSHGLDGAPVAHKLGQARRLSPGPAALDVPHARRVVARASHNPRVTGVAPRESKNRVAVRAPSPGGFLETATRRTQQRDTPVLVGRGEKSPADAGAGPGERKGGGAPGDELGIVERLSGKRGGGDGGGWGHRAETGESLGGEREAVDASGERGGVRFGSAPAQRDAAARDEARLRCAERGHRSTWPFRDFLTRAPRA